MSVTVAQLYQDQAPGYAIYETLVSKFLDSSLSGATWNQVQ